MNVGKYSVLMSVYAKENPNYLLESIESIMAQTIVPDDFVLVCDGVLTKQHYSIIDELKAKYNSIQIIQLEKNMGLGAALSKGLEATKNDLVMRMDSDDLCLPDRAEIQLPLMEQYDLVGGAISEFENTKDNIIGYRIPPKNYKQIVKFAKKRNPFNHPTVMFKKEKVEECGGYLALNYLEDYYLWIRFLLNNQKVYNVQNVLVNMRSGMLMRIRRSSKDAKLSIKKLRKFMFKHKFINVFSYVFGTFAQLFILSLPVKISVILYKKFLRKKAI